jgi:hypothetical protein
VAVRADTPSVGAEGGAGTLTITVNRECSWEASADVDWIVLTPPRAGQGNATLGFTVSGNPQPSVRRGRLVVNDSRVEVTQTGAACTFTLDAAFGTVGSAGGPLRVAVAGLAGCPWTAVSQASWVRVVSAPSGDGPGSVALEVDPNAGESRTGTVVIAGQSYTVAQGAAPPTPAPPVAGCAYTVGPDTLTLPSAGGTATVSISTTAGCAWTATTTAPWLALMPPAAGQGTALVTVSAAPNADAAVRTASVVVAGRSVLVVQDAAPPPTPPVVSCSYTVGPATQTLPAAGGTAVVTVAAPGGCAWTATSTVEWLVVLSAASGEGGATVMFSGAANASSTARTGNVIVAGQSVQIVQEGSVSTPNPACTYEVSPTAVSVGAAASTAPLTVTASGASCAWTASSSVPWVTVSAAAGSGSGQVVLTIAANETTSPRTGIVTVAGRSVQVSQAAADTPQPTPTCTYQLMPASLSVAAEGGPTATRLETGADCAWTAATQVPWITLASAPAGTGATDVLMTVAANTDTAPRTGIVLIGGQNLEVTQAAAPQPTVCDFTVVPVAQDIGADGGPGQVSVTATAPTCAWTATSNAPWIAVTSGAQGTGSGATSYQVAPNDTTTVRTGTLTVAGHVVTVTQQGQAPAPCTYQLTPTSVSVPAEGGEATARLDTASHCTWTATSQADWLTVVSGASGSGGVDLRVVASVNTASTARTGVVAIAGQTLTVTQAGAPGTVTTFSGSAASVGGICPNVTFRVMGMQIVTTSETKFEGSPCSALVNGMKVTGEGILQDNGTIRATRVQVQP